jgi:E3 ubiquitin-protein ligase MYCBP2
MERDDALFLAPAARLMPKATPPSAGLCLLTGLCGLSAPEVGLPRETLVAAVQKPLGPDDYSQVMRFKGNSGGWGYSSTSSDAIGFTVSTDVLIGGYGLYGAGETLFRADIKLLREDGNSSEPVAQCNRTYQVDGNNPHGIVMFDEPVLVEAGVRYSAYTLIQGDESSSCGSSGSSSREVDGVKFEFFTSSHSNNGTDVGSGQFPVILFSTKTAPVVQVAWELLPQ